MYVDLCRIIALYIDVSIILWTIAKKSNSYWIFVVEFLCVELYPWTNIIVVKSIIHYIETEGIVNWKSAV